MNDADVLRGADWLNLPDDQLDFGPLAKGHPGRAVPGLLDGRRNILDEDFPLPLCVIDRSAIEHNVRLMAELTDWAGVRLCPHGKTTMSPQLLALQLRAGAWGITAATSGHVQIYRAHGISRILLANQLVGAANIRSVLDELREDPDFDFYCLVDSVASLDILVDALRAAPIGRPLQVLLDVGIEGGRTGVRSLAQAMEVARAVRAAGPDVALRGVECFEGLVGRNAPAGEVGRHLRMLKEITEAFERERLFDGDDVIVTAGGSAWYDLVIDHLRPFLPQDRFTLVLRSGCYVTHDDIEYDLRVEAIRSRGLLPDDLIGFKPALELWAYVQSLPEPGSAILAFGKRDASYDIDLPLPKAWFRPGDHSAPVPLEGCAISRLNDQHAYMQMPPGCPVAIGDMIMLGISHPCTTFDKWRHLLVRDDGYRVIGAVRTFF